MSRHGFRPTLTPDRSATRRLYDALAASHTETIGAIVVGDTLQVSQAVHDQIKSGTLPKEFSLPAPIENLIRMRVEVSPFLPFAWRKPSRREKRRAAWMRKVEERRDRIAWERRVLDMTYLATLMRSPARPAAAPATNPGGTL